MNKQPFILLSSFALLLISCSNPASTGVSAPFSSPSSAQGSSVSSSPSESVSSSLEVEKRSKEITDFLALLTSKEGKVNQCQRTAIRTSKYLSDAEPLTMVEKDASTTIRYQGSSQGQVNDQNGSYSLQDSAGSYGAPSLYETQVYHDSALFYHLTKYLDGSEADSKKTIGYTAANEEHIFGLGLANEEIDLFATLKGSLNQADTEVSYVFPLEFPDNGEATYSYSVKVYESGSKVLRQEVSYEKTITLKNALIIHLEETLANDLYAGGKKANWFSTLISADYQQGDFASFTGTLFNPADFTAA